MSISFSGIASGLDTSSWIESLVALRRAKITTLQTQREELVSTQDTLNNIRSFFNTFKTTVQKITDSKFGNTSLFGRNIATSSNLGVLSATATNLAQAATYQIKVDQLATNTTAMSGFKNTITEESVANESTYIRELGGGINITDGMFIEVKNSYNASKNIGITNSTTIGDLLNSMRDFGLDASINNNGVITVSNGAITDGTPEILEALGFTSNVTSTTAQTDEITYEVTANVSYSTTLDEIIEAMGTQDKVADGYSLFFDSKNILVDGNTTLGNILNYISPYGGDMELDENGYLIVRGGELTGTVAEALGFAASEEAGIVYNTITSTAPITYEGSILVSGDTKIGYLEGISRTFLSVYTTSGSVTDIEYTTEDTIQSVFDKLVDYSIYASIDDDGVVHIQNEGNYYIRTSTSNLFDALGISSASGTHAVTNTSSLPVTYTKEVAATEDTKLTDLGVSVDGKITINECIFANGSYVGKPAGTITVTDGMTLGGLFDELEAYGIKASIDESGNITIAQQAGSSVHVASGAPMTILDLTMSTLTVATIGTVNTSTEAIRVKNMSARFSDSVFLKNVAGYGTFSVGSTLTIVVPTSVTVSGSSSGSVSRAAEGTVTTTTGVSKTISVTATENMTIANLVSSINAQATEKGLTSFSCEFNSTTGKLDIDTGVSTSSATQPAISGDLATFLEFGGYGGTDGNAHLITITPLYALADISSSTKVSAITGSTDSLEVEVYANGGLKTITVSASSSISTMLAQFTTLGFTTKLLSGRITITGKEGVYITNNSSNSDFMDAFKLSGDTFTNEVRTSETVSSELNYDATLTLSELTTLEDLDQTGNLTLSIYNGTSNKTLTFATTTTMKTMIETLAENGITASISGGYLIIGDQDDAGYVRNNLNMTFSNLFKLTTYGYTNTNGYNTSSSNAQYYTGTITADETTTLGTLGMDSGSSGMCIMNNGVAVLLSYTQGNTIGDIVNSLKSDYGIDAKFENGKFSFTNNENCYVSSIESNLQNYLNLDYAYSNSYSEGSVTVYKSATLKQNETHEISEGTTLSDLDITDGKILLNFDGEECEIDITTNNNETLDDFFDWLSNNNIIANVNEGKIQFSAGADVSFSTPTGGSSNILEILGLDNLDWTDTSEYTSKELNVISTRTEYTSAANFANENTTLKTLGITAGELLLEKGGAQVKIEIDPDKTFTQLNKDGIEFTFDEEGHLNISDTDGNAVYLMASVASTNFVSITGLSHKDDGTIVGTKKLYCVDLDSLVTGSDIFKKGDVSIGSFIVGDSEITIDNQTTIQGVINQINSSETSNAYASWDANNARIILESRTTGNGYIYVGKTASGSSNFTDILGFTNDNSLVFENQEQGKRAEYYIGNEFKFANTNILDSSLTGIAGVTINLKGLSLNGEYTTLTIEKDKETVANAVSDMVDSYNALIENIDKELAKGSDSRIASTLKLLKNQIRSYMTGIHANDGIYNSMNDIGISTKSATAGDISTSGISNIVFDKEEFMQAYSADSESVQKLLVGTDANKGMLWQLEEIVNTAVGSTTGYFSSTNNSYNKQISRLDDRIRKAEKDISVYRQRLERKFSAMELLITKMQDQYSSFLSTGFLM